MEMSSRIRNRKKGCLEVSLELPVDYLVGWFL